ncbi:hypothetical protein Syun_015248 [Stephania yunnanensis]|uniref:Uncharacterized protein n=1 Tax=Stephania yunnanensis TaxID=152371 RepID=A0AAP0JMJ3_9MAGN
MLQRLWFRIPVNYGNWAIFAHVLLVERCINVLGSIFCGLILRKEMQVLIDGGKKHRIGLFDMLFNSVVGGVANAIKSVYQFLKQLKKPADGLR